MLFMSAVAVTVMYISFSGYSTASVDIMDDVGLAYTQVGTLASASLWAGGIIVLFAWLFIGKYGPKKIAVLALCICALGLFMFAVAGSYITLILSRIVQGMGIALCFCAPYTLASNWCEGKKHGSVAMGVMMACDGFGLFFALYIYGKIITAMGWRMGTAAGALIILVIALVFALTVKDADDAKRPAHVEGGLARYYINILKKPNVISATLFLIGLWGVSNTGVYWIPTILMEDAGWSTGAASLAGTLNAVAGIVPGIVGGPVSDRMGRRKPMVIAGAVVFFVTVAAMAAAMAVSSYMLIAAMLFAAGFASYISQPLLYTMASESVKTDEASAAIGCIQGIGLIFGAALFPALAGIIRDVTGSYVILFIVLTAATIFLNIGGALFSKETLNR